MMTVSSASRTPRSLWSAMPQDLRRKSSEDYDAINPDFPPPSLKPLQNDGGREQDKQKKKDKKWSIGGLFRRKKKVSDTDSSSPIDDEEEKKGFLERRRAARKRRNRGSKDVTGSFEHVKISHTSRQQQETPDQIRTMEIPNERLVGRSHESLAKMQPEVNHIRGSSVSLEGACKKGGRFQIKARVEASRERLKVNSSSDEGEGSSRHSTCSMQRVKCDESMGSKDGSLSRRSRAARTERYKKRLSRDEESLRDFQISPPSRISRSDERLTGKRMEKTPSSNRWTAKVVYCESSDYDTKYTAKTKSATPSPIQSPKARPKNALHYTASAPSASSYVTYPPSHAREGVAGSYQELRSYRFPSGGTDHRHKQTQQFNDLTPPRLPKSSSELINKGSFQNHTSNTSSWAQDKINRKSASYDCNVNSLHFAHNPQNQISQPHPTEENVLVVQFPISKPSKRGDPTMIFSEKSPNQLQHVPKQQNPPPPPPRDPHRRLVPSNGVQHETSPRPMSYAFEDRHHHHTKYQAFPEFGSSVSAFQRVPQTNPIDIQPAVSINKHHRSNSDHHIPQKMNCVKYSPPMARRPSSAQQDYAVNKSYHVSNDTLISNSPKDGQGVSYQYYADQQPRSRKPIHIGYQKPTNDPYLSDSQVIVKPPLQQIPRTRPIAVLNASEFWKQKDQENTKKVHVSEGSPKLMQRHLLNVTVPNERSRSNSPHAENTVSSKLKLPPLIMPPRGGDSYGSFSGQSSPRDVPSPRTPSSRRLVHNEVGIPVFDVSEPNTSAKREYRPLSMLEEKQEIPDQEISPVKEKLTNPPTPPTRRNSKVTNITNFDNNFDVFSDNDINETRRKSCNLEDALNELEAIYKSLRLNEEGYIEKVAKEKALYENNRLDPSNWNAWVQSRGFESDSSFNYSRSSLESVDSIDSPLKISPRSRRHAVPDRVADDMAYRRLNKKERPTPQEQEVISQAGSFLLVSPTLSPPPFKDAPVISPTTKEPDITLDDVVYRNIKHVQNTLKISDPQPPFGIPLGPVTPAPNSDYLHVTPKETFRPTFKPRKIPDVVSDDLAFRNLRKDGNKEPLFPPEDTSLIDSPTLKKKRAVRSLSANLLSIIQKESASLKNSNKLIYNNNNNNVNNDLEKSQSFTNVTDAININGVKSKNYLPITLKLGEPNAKKNLSGDDSDVTPRGSRFFPAETTSPSIATSTETLTGSKASLWSQESKQHHKLSQNASPRLSITPERRHTTFDIHTRTSKSPVIQLSEKDEYVKSNVYTNTTTPKLPDRQRSPTPDSHTYTHHSDKQGEDAVTLYDDSESDLLAILAREAKEASEQLSKELYELNLDCKNNILNAEKSDESIFSKDLLHSKVDGTTQLEVVYDKHAKDHEVQKGKEDIDSTLTSKYDNLPHKTLPIGKIIPHKPVILNTFCITEDNRLENKQTVITQTPFEIEGSKSMSDLLKELTRSLDFDFGTPTKDVEKSSPNLIDDVDKPEERRPEEVQNIDETKEETHSDTNEPRTTDRKESEEKYFSSVEEIHEEHLSSPERALLSSLAEASAESEDVQRLQTLSPTNSFPLEISEEQTSTDSKQDPEVVTGDSRDLARARTPEPESGRCSMDCSTAADEGKVCLKNCVTTWTTCVNHAV